MASADKGTYWIVAVPNWWAAGTVMKDKPPSQQDEAETKKLTRRALNMKTERLSDNFDLPIPKLKVGTLDALMALSDELGKVDTLAEGLVKKFKRSYHEFKGKDAQELLVEGKNIHAYIEEWQWNAAKYPVAAPLRDLTTRIQQDLLSNDDDLKKKSSKFMEYQTAVTSLERKETGTLLVRPLGPLVKPEDILEKDFITTLLVVVPKAKEQEFLATYETLERDALSKPHDAEHHAPAKQESKLEQEQKAPTELPAHLNLGPGPINWETVKAKFSELDNAALKALEARAQEEAEAKERELQERRKKREGAILNVVPRSAKNVYSDTEYSLFRVVVFKKGVDTIKNLFREKRYTVRPYEYDPRQAELDKDRRNELTQQKNKTLALLLVWLETKYSEVVAAWLHLKAIRTYIEAVLRYGIPVNFQANVLKVRKGQHSKLRKSLSFLYNNLAGGDLTGAAESESSDMGGLAGGGDFFPYVFFSIDLEDE